VRPRRWPTTSGEITSTRPIINACTRSSTRARAGGVRRSCMLTRPESTRLAMLGFCSTHLHRAPVAVGAPREGARPSPNALIAAGIVERGSSGCDPGRLPRELARVHVARLDALQADPRQDRLRSTRFTDSRRYVDAARRRGRLTSSSSRMSSDGALAQGQSRWCAAVAPRDARTGDGFCLLNNVAAARAARRARGASRVADRRTGTSTTATARRNIFWTTRRAYMSVHHTRTTGGPGADGDGGANAKGGPTINGRAPRRCGDAEVRSGVSTTWFSQRSGSYAPDVLLISAGSTRSSKTRSRACA